MATKLTKASKTNRVAPPKRTSSRRRATPDILGAPAVNAPELTDVITMDFQFGLLHDDGGKHYKPVKLRKSRATLAHEVLAGMRKGVNS